jgi:hypothetical protein
MKVNVFKLWALVVMLSLAVLPAMAQETRGNISGTVKDSTGVVPGATVQITSADTGATQSLITNSSGYFEAPLLQAGNYTVSVEMTGFKKATRTGIVLAVSQQLSIPFTLELGQISENITVTGEAPLLDTSSVSSGQNFDNKLIEGLPAASNQPILLVKFAQGIVSPTTQQQVLQGQIDGPNDGAGTPVGGVGSFNYTLDGATNAGNNRRMASSPNQDIVQEMRVETSNFDASQGHGTGASVALMTKAGTNALRGTVNYQFYSVGLNSTNPQQKLLFAQRPDTEKAYNAGKAHNIAFTSGGPVVKNKIFFFGNFQYNVDDTAARNTPTSRVPANQAELNGDFSDLLTLPSPAQYIIYDPLTVRPDPTRAGGVIRDPFPGNIIPKDRFMNADGSYKNPLFGLFKDMMPAPNQNFVEQLQVPDANYYQGATPNYTTASNYGGRLDYNVSSNDRIFFRYAGTKFHEQLGDWTYETKYKGLHTNDKTRASWAYTGSWTKVLGGGMVVDTSVSTNRFHEDQQRRKAHDYKPTDVGLPSYLDTFCAATQNCMLPVVNVGGYQGIGLTADGGLQSTNVQGQSTVTSVKGSHTLHGGVDLRLARFQSGLLTAGNVNSTYSFDNTYTRATDGTVVPSSTIGTSIAALMLGLPTSVSIGTNAPLDISNPYYGTFFQDSWRLSQNLTIGLGVRYEYEDGIKEKQNRIVTGFNPTATLAITDLAQAAYAKSPIPQVAVSDFKVIGGSIYATKGEQKTWQGQSMWMPRLSAGYKLGDKTVIKGGYGIFYDTLNAADQGVNQLGYSVTTTNVLSTDFGQTFLLGNPRAGVSPIADPFPVRSTGSRFESPLQDSLGVDTIDGTSFSRENPNRDHARVQRWRVGIQRELFGTTAVEVAYSGSYADHVGLGINAAYIPESYYVGGNVRDTSAQTLLQQNVPNPFNLTTTFASFQTSNPALYNRMAGIAFFTGPTVQRQQLIRQNPQLTGLTYNNLPLGIVKSNNLEITVNRRYSHGLSANLAFSANHVLENRTVETYEQAPSLFLTSNNARPWSLRGGAVYELPFGNNKPLLKNGGFASKILGGWQTGGTWEYQPGALLNFGNLFFNGDLNSIAKKNPEIAIQLNGTVDQSKTWFNTEAGFEKLTANQPASFQKRSFPFRVDGVRTTTQFLANINLVRNFGIGHGRSLQARLDVQNVFNTPLWNGPNVDPTSTNFGKITGATNSIMRFITFVGKLNF